MTAILLEKHLSVPMRDGVLLATDVYRLNGAPPAPVLLARTPYNKEHALAGERFNIVRAVQAGYVVVIQDVRGRFASEGVFNPQFQEREDGVDTIAWVAAQPWSSVPGLTETRAAVSRSASLVLRQARTRLT